MAEEVVSELPDSFPAVGSDIDSVVSVLNDKSAWDHLSLAGSGWVSACTLMVKPDYDVVDDDGLWNIVITEPALPSWEDSLE
jgi:hypothetical protein